MKMKKIGIITLMGDYNFGNKLQLFALSKVLQDMNFHVNAIWYKKRVSSEPVLKSVAKAIIRSPGHIRAKRFRKFNNLLTIKKYNQLNFEDKYNYFVVGSDQVWNPNDLLFDPSLFFCKFANPKKRISYAASVGVTRIDKAMHNTFKEGVNGMASVSVREINAKKELEKISGRTDIEVNVDPTMLLSSSEWTTISKKPRALKHDNYVLCYFLGEFSEKRKIMVEKYAKKHNAIIIDLLNKNDPFYTCGPQEFLYLEKHAKLICTDSFHATIFSIIFQRPFFVFDRIDKSLRDMSSRIDYILEKTKLKERRIVNDDIDLWDGAINYDVAKSFMDKERARSFNYLIKNLNVSDDV